MLKKIQKTAKFIKKQISADVEIAIVLGSGLGRLSEQIENAIKIPYEEIPNFPVSTVAGHKGQLVFGKLSGKNVIAMQGRFHYYEGYSMQEITFPIRVFKELGIKVLILSNAAGGMNKNFSVGDIMIINDHINLMPSNPLIGKNYDKLGPRFPDMSEAYNKTFIKKVKEIAEKHNIKIHEGVYVALTGPCYETPAEYRFLRIIGADAVGMSTIPEVIVARHSGIDCVAFSIITDLGGMDEIKKISHEEVVEAASKAEPKLSLIVKEFIRELR